MATVRREAPRQVVFYSPTTDVETWLHQCILDLADGRHAKDCDCTGMQSILLTDFSDNKATNTDLIEAKWNACLTISRCARDLISYSVEESDESQGA